MDDSAETMKEPPAPVKPKPAVAARDERLAARLRENLRKRKEQARQRGE